MRYPRVETAYFEDGTHFNEMKGVKSSRMIMIGKIEKIIPREAMRPPKM